MAAYSVVGKVASRADSRAGWMAAYLVDCSADMKAHWMVADLAAGMAVDLAGMTVV